MKLPPLTRPRVPEPPPSGSERNVAQTLPDFGFEEPDSSQAPAFHVRARNDSRRKGARARDVRLNTKTP